MKKQTQEQFLETIDGLLSINEQLRANLAEREAECLKLQKTLLMVKSDPYFSDLDAESQYSTEQALSTQTSTSYLEQWEKEHYQVVGYFGYERVHGIAVQSLSGHQSKLHNAPLYARKG